jgi:hypothetical protein
MEISRPSLLLAATLSVAIGTVAQTRQPPSNLPKGSEGALIVHPLAKNVEYAEFLGSGHLTYKIAVPYPADTVLQFIAKELSEKGWRPLREDFLNPGLPSSHVRGWTQYADATREPHETVHQWLAQWQNEAQELVWLSIQYRYPESKPPQLKTAEVFLAFSPAAIAKRMKEDAKRDLGDNRSPRKKSQN